MLFQISIFGPLSEIFKQPFATLVLQGVVGKNFSDGSKMEIQKNFYVLPSTLIDLKW